MSSDILKGQWKQVRGQAKIWWGKLTDSDLDQIEGNRDKLVGALQAKYGYSREKANEEIDRHLRDYQQPPSSRP